MKLYFIAYLYHFKLMVLEAFLVSPTSKPDQFLIIINVFRYIFNLESLTGRFRRSNKDTQFIYNHSVLI